MSYGRPRTMIDTYEAEMRRRGGMEAYYRMRAAKEQEEQRRAEQERHMIAQELAQRREADYQAYQSSRLPRYVTIRRPPADTGLLYYRDPALVVSVDAAGRRPTSEQEAHSIVRGPNGTLYRVPLMAKDSSRIKTNIQNTPQEQFSLRSDENEAKKGTEKKTVVDTRIRDTKKRQGKNATSREQIATLTEEKPVSRRSARVQINQAGKENQSLKAPVVVEEASDDESDEETLRSVWQNRRPAPGQWIEPVEGY